MIEITLKKSIQALWDDTVIVTRTEGNRHYVIFTEEGEEEVRLSFCNFCASPFLYENNVCAGCKTPL